MDGSDQLSTPPKRIKYFAIFTLHFIQFITLTESLVEKILLKDYIWPLVLGPLQYVGSLLDKEVV